jgi:fructose/tagatose bisphosphate aldolase
MALISMRQMLDHAAEFGYGVPAFNVNNLEQMRAIMEAADKTESPVIVQASAGGRSCATSSWRRSKNSRTSRCACTRITAPARTSASVRSSSVSPR